jgi:SAM-dependent methyltransferase
MQLETSHTEVEARFLSETLGAHARVLDAGCGRRTRLAHYKERIAYLVGVDLDEPAGRSNSALDSFVRADLCGRLPFDDASFDLVYSNFAIEHLPAPLAAFREWRRVLRPGGNLVLLTSNHASPYVWAGGLLPQRLRVAVKRAGPGAAERDVFPALYRANTPGRLVALLTEAGFRPVSVVYVATLHRYAGERRRIASLLQTAERVLPTRARSTIVGWFEAA